MYERRSTPPLSRSRFLLRMAFHASMATTLLAASLLGGMWGYARFEDLEWRDAFLNAAMLLGGMGPVETPVTPAGKVFAGVFALYAGLVFILGAGLLLAPAVHRMLHRFHWEGE